MRSAMLCLSLMLLFGQGPPKEPWTYRSFTSDFERVADSTSGLPMPERVKVFRSTFDKLCPGLYAAVSIALVLFLFVHIAMIVLTGFATRVRADCRPPRELTAQGTAALNPGDIARPVQITSGTKTKSRDRSSRPSAALDRRADRRDPSYPCLRRHALGDLNAAGDPAPGWKQFAFALPQIVAEIG
jgi:hypothetical protein